MSIKNFKIQANHCLLVPSCNEKFDVNAIAEAIKNFINENDCKKLVLNLKGFNLVDVSSVTIIASAYHFSKYSKEGSFRVIVDNEEIQKALAVAKLDNTEVILEDTLGGIYYSA